MTKGRFFIGMTEEDLINGCKKNSRLHQEALFRKYSRKIYGLCLRYAQSSLEAEDIMQEAFVKIFHHIGNYRHVGSFEGWMSRIAINLAIEYYRKSKRIIFVESYEEVAEPAFNPQVLEKLDAEQITRVINLLPEGYRMVFNLYAIEGFNHREIGELLGIAEGTSKSQFARAKAHLLKLLEQKLDIFKEDRHVRA